MIIYKKGDLLDAPQLNIIHQVNCKGSMGAGIAKSIKNKYPLVYEDYLYMIKSELSHDKCLLLGESTCTLINDNSQRLFNLFGQVDYYPRNKRHTDYNALESGFTKIKHCYNGDIAMPKIGCGLGGGDWKVVSKIIEEVFNDRDVYIYEL